MSATLAGFFDVFNGEGCYRRLLRLPPLLLPPGFLIGSARSGCPSARCRLLHRQEPDGLVVALVLVSEKKNETG